MLEWRHLYNNSNHHLLLKKLTPKQQLNIKESTIDMNNRLNRIFSSFNPLSFKFSSRDRLINIFSSCFLFYFTDQKNKESRKTYTHKLDELIFQMLAEWPPQYLIFMFTIILSSRLSIMWSISLPQKWNFLLSDAASIKLPK